MWRIYSVYTDNLTGNFTIRLAVEKNWSDRSPFYMDFMFGATCGSITGTARDSYSTLLEIPSSYPNSVHAELYGYVNPTNTVKCGQTNVNGGAFTIYSLELQALDVYE